MYLTMFSLFTFTEMNLLCWLGYNSKMLISTEHLTQFSLSKTDTVHNVNVCMTACVCVHSLYVCVCVWVPGWWIDLNPGAVLE